MPRQADLIAGLPTKDQMETHATNVMVTCAAFKAVKVSKKFFEQPRFVTEGTEIQTGYVKIFRELLC